MISDVLSDALGEISDYQRELPWVYDEFHDEIEKVKRAMYGLQVRLDNPPPTNSAAPLQESDPCSIEEHDDEIPVAEGQVNCPLYQGLVSISINAEYHGLLDLLVWHEAVPEFGLGCDLLADNPVFGREVIRVLQEAAKLPPGDNFVLHSAERGMQRPYLAVFESLCRAGHDVGRVAAISWGAVDQELAEERDWLFGMSLDETSE